MVAPGLVTQGSGGGRILSVFSPAVSQAVCHLNTRSTLTNPCQSRLLRKQAAHFYWAGEQQFIWTQTSGPCPAMLCTRSPPCRALSAAGTLLQSTNRKLSHVMNLGCMQAFSQMPFFKQTSAKACLPSLAMQKGLSMRSLPLCNAIPFIC